MLNHQNKRKPIKWTQFRDYIIFYALYERGVVCYTPSWFTQACEIVVRPTYGWLMFISGGASTIYIKYLNNLISSWLV